MTKRVYGHTESGVPITDEMIEQLADEADQGYDIKNIRARRQPGRPRLGSAPSSVESVRLDPDLKQRLLERAEADGVSVSQVIRDALQRHLTTPRPDHTVTTMHLEHTALLVDDYDEAIEFFVQALGFELIEDTPATTNDGRPKRWVVVRPPGAMTGLLLAQADGEYQRANVGAQYAGRVGLFLRVDNFEAAHEQMLDHSVEFITEPRDEPYGRVVVFVDIAGNRWDLLSPRP